MHVSALLKSCATPLAIVPSDCRRSCWLDALRHAGRERRLQAPVRLAQVRLGALPP
jgi:hypothetical protein